MPKTLIFIRIPSVELARFIAIGFTVGWIMGKIRRGRGYGLIGNLFIGTIGSLIGWFLMGLSKIEASGKLPDKKAGSCVMLAVSLLSKG